MTTKSLIDDRLAVEAAYDLWLQSNPKAPKEPKAHGCKTRAEWEWLESIIQDECEDFDF